MRRLKFILRSRIARASLIYLSLIISGSGLCLGQKPQLVVQTGHTGAVTFLVFSPDGRSLVSGGYDSTIKFWEASTGRELRTLGGHVGGVHSVAFSPDGKKLASGGLDRTIRIWDLSSGKELSNLTGHTYPVFSVAFSPDGQTLMSTSGDGTFRRWDIATGKILQTISLAGTRHITLSPNQKTLIDAAPDHTIELRDSSTGAVFRTLAGFSEDILSVAVSADSKVAAACSSTTIKLWEIADGRELPTIAGGFELASNLTFSPNGRVLAGSIGGRTIKLWDVNTGREVNSFTGYTRPVEALQFSPGGQILAGSDRGGRIKLWEMSTGRELTTLRPRAMAVRSVVFAQDGQTLASSVAGGKVKLWNGTSARELITDTSPGQRGASPIAITRDGRNLASASERVIKVWEIATGREITSFRVSGNIRWMAFSPDGKSLAGGEYTINIWDVQNGTNLRTFENYYSLTEEGVFSPDGKTLAVVEYGTSVRLWDVQKGKEIGKLAPKYPSFNSVAFSGDGKTLATGGTDGSIMFWTLPTLEPIRELRGHDSFVETLAFSPDGTKLASGSWDQTVKLWDLPTGRAIQTLTGHTTPVESVAFSPDGRFLVSGGDATTRIWRAATGEFLASLIALDDDDWAVVSPDGAFDSSPGAQKLMHWMVGSEPIDLAQLKERYYEPGLFGKLLNDESLREVNKFEDPKLYPEVNYEPPVAGSNIFFVNLVNRGGGIGRVQVFVNDKEFLADARDERLKANPNVKQASLRIDLGKASSARAGGENRIKVLAWNVENYISSRGEETPWVAAGSTNKAAPEVYAIVAGISQYASPKINLSFAAKDAVAIANVIELGAKRLFGADKVHLSLLSTASDPRAVPPTKSNFAKAFATARRARSDDILIVYLAGHGITLPSVADTYCYLTQEARNTDAVTLSDPEVRKQATVTSEELVEWIKLIPANKQVVILDTCAAGAAQGHLTLALMRSASGDAIRALERAKERTGSYILMGSAADSASYESSQYGQGLLTYSLLKGLKGAALRDDTLVDISKLFRFAREEVEQLAKKAAKIQRPIIFAPRDDTFDVGQLNLEDRRQITLASPKPIILRPRFLETETGDDTLELMRGLRALLRDEALADNGATEPALIFVDEEDFPEAIRPTGTYTISGEKVRLVLRLRRDGADISTVEVTGTKVDLATRVMQAIKASLRNFAPP